MVIASILAAVIATTLVSPAHSQDQRKTRIGVVGSGSAAASMKDFIDGLRQGLAAVGLVEDRNIILDIRYAQGRVDQLNSIATDLTSSGSGILFAGGDQAASAAQRATKTVPIVAVTCDALAAGLVTNLARPGGNLTGVTCINSDLSGKRVELLREAAPAASVIGVTLDPADRRMVAEFVEAQHAGVQYGIKTPQIPITNADHIETGFERAAKEGVNGIVVVFDAMLFFHRARLAKAAIDNRLPTIFNFHQFTEAGGLMSFGPNLRDMYRQSGRHFLKIVKGEAPGQIPMEQPIKFEWVINLKTAKAIGLTVPPTLLARADEVIE
jgi:putative ABC transport system substrate-binding protein